MFISKHKKAIISLAVIAVIALGSVTAFAASAGVSLTPAGYVDLSKVDFTPGTFTVVEGVTPNIEGGNTYTTAPGLSLTAVSGNIGTANVQEGTFTVVEGVIPNIEGGNTYTTAPGLSLTAVSGNIDTANVQEGIFTVVEGVTPQIVGGYAYTTAAK